MIADLTAEEQKAALDAAAAAKAERAKGTSTEHSEQLMELSPEMQKAIATGVNEAVNTIFESEVERRQKFFGEDGTAANREVGNIVDMGKQRKQREQKENEILARFVSALFRKDKGEIEQCFLDEEKYLGRRTIATDKDLKRRAMGGSTAGDELMPEIWTNRLIENIERHGLVRRLATIIPMTSDTMKFPKVTTGLTAYEVSAGSQITAADLVTATLTLNTRKLATITALHNELLVNADPSIIPLLTEQAAIALAAKEDDMALTGASTTVDGILESATNNVINGGSSSSGATSIADVDFDDMARLIDALDSQYIDDGCAFFFNKKVLFHLHALASASGYLWAPATNGAPSTIRGFPYYTSSKMSAAPSITTAYAFFGNLKHLYMGDRNAMTISIGTEGTVGSDNLFEKAMTALRVTELVEFEISDAEGFSVLKTSTT